MNREYMSSMSIFANDYYRGTQGMYPSCKIHKIIPYDVFPIFFVQHYYPIRWSLFKKFFYVHDIVHDISNNNMTCV